MVGLVLKKADALWKTSLFPPGNPALIAPAVRGFVLIQHKVQVPDLPLLADIF